MIPHNVFIPKERNEALFIIAHELTHQLVQTREELAYKEETSNPEVGCEKQQIKFLENLIDAIQRS